MRVAQMAFLAALLSMLADAREHIRMCWIDVMGWCLPRINAFADPCRAPRRSFIL